jgi:hypothetical protein
MTSPGFSRSIRQFIGKNILRHRSLARRPVVARRRAVLVVPESQCPQPRRSYRRRSRLHDSADNDPISKSCSLSLPIISFHHQAGRDCNQYYHLLWLPDCWGRKTEQCAERRGESSRGFGVDRAAGYRFEQGRSGDRTVHSPSPPQRSQLKCPRLR